MIGCKRGVQTQLFIIEDKNDNQNHILGMDYEQALDFTNKHDTLGTYERMKENGYLRKKLIV